MTASGTPSRGWTAVATLQGPTIRTVPSGDRAFARFARHLLLSLPDHSPATLESRLRRVFPRAIVRRCDLEDAADAVWYAYREGRWLPSDQAVWWLDDEVPLVVLDGASFVVEANDAAEAFVGDGRRSIVGRHLTDFAIEGTLAEALELQAAYVAEGEVSGTMQFRAASGAIRACEQHAWHGPEDRTFVAFRPLGGDVLAETAPGRVPRDVALRCEPERDALFRRYVHILVARMPEPTAEGLELRLRRVYPLATVVAAEGASWRCRRDAVPPLPDGWWHDESLPRIVFDRQSLIHRANDAACAAMGFGLVGRFWRAFAVPSSVPDTDLLIAAIAEVGQAETGWQYVSERGAIVYFECHVEVVREEQGPELFLAILHPRRHGVA